MRKAILILVATCLAVTLSKAQGNLELSGQSKITVTGNAKVYVKGDLELKGSSSLSNGGLIYLKRNLNNSSSGNLNVLANDAVAGSGKIIFNGDTAQHIYNSATNHVYFRKLKLEKTWNNNTSDYHKRVFVHSDIYVQDSIILQINTNQDGGNIYLDNKNLILEDKNVYKGLLAYPETQYGDIRGPGKVVFETLVNATANNIGGLGLTLNPNTGYQLGTTKIARGHETKPVGKTGVSRYFEISPSQNTKSLVRVSYNDYLQPAGTDTTDIYQSENNTQWDRTNASYSKTGNIIQVDKSDDSLSGNNNRDVVNYFAIGDPDCINLPVIPDAGDTLSICSPETTVKLNLGKGLRHYFESYPAGATTTRLNDSTWTVNKTGLYKIRVLNDRGCAQTGEVYVRAGVKPVPDFIVNGLINDAICINASLSYKDTSTVSSGYIASRTWDFGDNNSDTSLQGAHAYTYSGQKQLRLTIMTDLECQAVKTKTLQVNPYPVPNFSYEGNRCFGEFIQFTNLSTVESSYSYNSYWEFNDNGQTSTTKSPSYKFSQAGNQTIKLTVTTGTCAASKTQAMTYWPQPIADFTVDDVCDGSTTTPDNLSTATPWLPTSSTFVWTLDGSNLNGLFEPTYSLGPGPHTLKLKATLVGNSRCVDETSVKSFNVDYMPQAKFTNSTNCTDNKLHFTDNSTIGGDQITGWNWSFGDSKSSAVQNAVHRYSAVGSYNVTLQVTSDQGCQNSKTKAVQFYAIPVDSFIVNDTCHTNTHYFVNKSSISHGSVSYLWDFGDTTSSTSTNYNKVYAYPGIHPVSLTVTSDSGCSRTYSKNVKVHYRTKPQYRFTNDCQKEWIAFTDKTKYNGSSSFTYYWNFGSDDDNSGKNDDSYQTGSTSHQFLTDGQYQVKLKTTTSEGCADSITKTVIVHPNPKPGFQKENVCHTFTNHFTSTSTIHTGAISTYAWTFGEGGSSALQNPAYRYQNPGNYNVKLVVTSDSNCTSDTTQQLTVWNKPVSKFSFTDNCNDSIIDFSDQSVIASPDSIAGRYWDLGDGTSKTNLEDFQKSYAQVKNYTVTLITTSDDGCKDTLARQVPFYALPHAVFKKDNACFNTANVLKNRSFISSGSLAYTWDYGDGASATTTNTSHIYTTYGSKNVSLIALSDSGCYDTFTRTIYVHPRSTPGFRFDNVCDYDSVRLMNTTTIPYGDIQTYYWDFGDGNSSYARNGTNKYAVYGYKTVKLRVTTDSNCTDSITKNVYVNLSPVAQFSSLPVCLDKSVQFTNQSSIGNGENLTYTWNYFDGIKVTTVNPIKKYTYPNTYPVELVAKSDSGCVDTVVNNTVVYPLPVVGFGFSNKCLGEEISFTNSSIIVTGSISSYYWSFGDGSNSTAKNPNHTYSSPGDYFVKLVCTSDNGCMDSLTRKVTVYPLPVAGFTTSNVCLGNNSVFTNTSTISSGTLTYLWSMGDNAYETSTNVSKKYGSAGTYSVSLVATSARGCKDTATTTVSVYALPVENFGGGALTTCGTTLDLNAGNTGSSYLWSPGNQTTQSITVTQNGTYSVRITNGNNCIIYDTAVVTLNSQVNPDLGNNRGVCGVDSLDAGYAGSTYLWSTAATSRKINVTNSGTFWVKVTDPNNCIGYDTVTITVNANPSFSLGADKKVCPGSSTTLDAGISGKKYLWSEGNAATKTLSVSTPKIYWVKVTDSITSCYSIDSINVLNYTVTKLNLGSDTSSCDSVFLDAGNHYAYLWPDNSTGQLFKVTTTGDYRAGVKDVHGCWSYDTIHYTRKTNPVVNLGSNAAICDGESKTLDAGNPGSTYLWSTSDTTKTIQAVNQGIYWVKVTNSDGCQAKDEVTVNVGQRPQVSLGNNKSACSGKQVTLDANVYNQSYLWSTNETTRAITPTSSGSYWVKVINSSGCFDTDTVQVNFFTLPVVNLGNDTTVCDGNSILIDAQNNGAAFLWNDNATTQSRSLTSTGTFWVRVTDSNACQAYDTIKTTFASMPAKPFGNDTSLCNTIKLDALNTGSTYLWNDNSTSRKLTAASTGTYWVKVQKGSGCFIYDTIHVTVNIPAPLNLGADFSMCDGVVFPLRATRAGASYLWNDNTTDSILKVSKTGKYWVELTDSNGCKVSDEINITVDPTPKPLLGADKSTCASQMIVLDPQNVGSTYQWQDFSLSRLYTPQSSGLYWVKVINKYGCSITDSIQVTLFSLPSKSLGQDVLECAGNSVQLDAGNTGDAYLWSTSAKTQTIQVNSAGNYWVKVTDTNSCFAYDTVNVSYGSLPVKSLGPDQVVCDHAILNAGNSGARYYWNTGDSVQSITVTNSGIYTVRVVNGSQCEMSDTVDITIHPNPVVNIGNDFSLCEGDIKILKPNISGTYLWSDLTTGDSMIVASTGKYWLKVTDTNNCAGTDSVVSVVYKKPVVYIGQDEIICKGSPKKLDAGNAGSTYYWNSSRDTFVNTQAMTVSDTGKYWVTVTNTDGCIASDTINLLPTNQNVVAGFYVASLIHSGDTVQFFNASHPGILTYTWDFGDGSISYLSDPDHIYSGIRKYDVVLMATNGTCSDTVIENIVVEKRRQYGNEIPPNDLLRIVDMKVYPNPAKDYFNFEVELNKYGDIDVLLYDIYGHLVSYEHIDNIRYYKKVYNTYRLAKGPYILKVLAERSDSKYFKIIKL